MLDYNFSLENLRFHLTKKDTLVFYGWYRENNPDHRSLRVCLDAKELELAGHVRRGIEIRQKYLNYQADINEEVVGEVTLPKDWRSSSKLTIICVHEAEEKIIRTITVKKLVSMQESVDYYLETENLSEDTLIFSGWAMAEGEVTFTLKNQKGKELPLQVERYYRKDVMAVYEDAAEGVQAGFKVTAPAEGSSFELLMQCGERKSIYRCTASALAHGKTQAGAAQPGMIKKIAAYYQRHGLKGTIDHARARLFRQSDEKYNIWRKQYLYSEEQLEAQRQEHFSYEPVFSIVIPVYQTPERYLRAMIDSVTAQTYAKWELCLADGGGAESRVRTILEEYHNKDARIRYELLASNDGISQNTNAALKMAQGDYIVFADHDDLIAPEALYECVKVLQEDHSLEMIYTDEDKVDMKGKSFFEPNFKPDLNIDLLCSVNYICHLCVVKKELLQRVGMLQPEFDGAQDHDFILRCVEEANRVHHIPRVLYHWRCHMNSTAQNPESKLYAFEAGRRAVEEHYRRLGIPATTEHARYYGMYHTTYHWQEQPLVSILIPNKDHIEDLKTCMNSIIEKSTYRNFEFIIIENNSTEESTFAAYKQLEADYAFVHVVYYDGDFNFSKINNFGAQHAAGSYYLLLNNDTEIISPDTITEMLGYCMREDVGIVGAKLCYSDDTIQHAGVVIGFGGIAGHTFIGSSRYDIGYQSRIICAQDYSAVTAACMMTKKEVFDAVGGLTEELKVAFNDIDYCLKVRELGKLVVYDPYAELYHYESKSRGLEDTPEKVARFQREIAVFQERWPEILKSGDPYFNPNLSLDKADFSLK